MEAIKKEKIKINLDKKKINIFVLTMVSVMVLVLVVTLWISMTDSIAQEFMTIQTTQYGKWDGHIDLERESLESGLYLFPEGISSAIDTNYLYSCDSDYHSINRYLIYAAVTYSEEDYQKEVERIANTKCEIIVNGEGERVTNAVTYSEELFAYPAYIAIYASNNSYEYTLLNEENNEIIYVYLQLKDGNGIIPDEHLPIETLAKDMYENNSWDNKNIYYSEDENGDYTYYTNSF